MKQAEILSRVRLPKTQIFYDVEAGDVIEKKSLPVVFGFFGWSDAELENNNFFQSEDIKVKKLDFDFSKLLHELVSVDEITESKLYEIIYASQITKNDAYPYTAIFIRAEKSLSEKCVSKLNALAKICHTSFIFNHQSQSNSDKALLAHLCQQFDTRGWFYQSEYTDSSLTIIYGSNKLDEVHNRFFLNLCACRWVHYVLVIIRNNVNHLISCKDIQDYLCTWISQYVLLDENAPEEISMRYPLLKANVTAKEYDGANFKYELKVELRLSVGFNDKPSICMNMMF